MHEILEIQNKLYMFCRKKDHSCNREINDTEKRLSQSQEMYIPGMQIQQNLYLTEPGNCP
jgi:hypothetical protein